MFSCFETLGDWYSAFTDPLMNPPFNPHQPAVSNQFGNQIPGRLPAYTKLCFKLSKGDYVAMARDKAFQQAKLSF